jgi:predicted dehydrogenase
MGSGHCRRASGDIPEVELTAICDIDPNTRAEISEKYRVPGFDKHTALLDSGLVDAVIIATPHYFHPPIAIDAFARGLHVLSEKPIGVTVGAADEMIKAAKASGKKFVVMYQMRIEPAVMAARKIVESGALGEIYRTSLTMAWYRSQAYYDSGGWRATWSGEGGGVLINQAPHHLDLFTYLGGMPATIQGQTRTRLHKIEVEDEAFAFLEYPNGAHGYLYASTTEMPDFNMIQVCGDRGKLILDDKGLRAWGVKPGIKQFTVDNATMWASPELEEIPFELPPQMEPGGHGAITRNFARSILFDEPLISPGEQGLNAVELINGVILSGHTGERINLPVDRERYESLINHLKAQSQVKAEVKEQRVTDPHYT